MTDTNETTRFEKAVGILRITLGAGFLYAGLEKVLQLGGSGPFNAGGFLKGATGGAIPGSTATQIVNPTHGFWVSLAANTDAVSAINFLVQFGELAIGVALILGFALLCGQLELRDRPLQRAVHVRRHCRGRGLHRCR